MRRGFAIALAVFAVLAAVAVGVAAYDLGVSHGVDQAVVSAVSGEGGADVVRVVDGVGYGRGWGGPGPGFVFFPLFLILGFVLLIRFAFARPWGPPGRWRGPGPWGAGDDAPDPWSRRAEAWHRRQHGEDADDPGWPSGSSPQGRPTGDTDG